MRLDCDEVLNPRAEVYVQLQIHRLHHRFLERQRPPPFLSPPRPSKLTIIQSSFLGFLKCESNRGGLKHLYEAREMPDNPFVLHQAEFLLAHLRHVQLPRVDALGRVQRPECLPRFLHDGGDHLQLPDLGAAP